MIVLSSQGQMETWQWGREVSEWPNCSLPVPGGAYKAAWQIHDMATARCWEIPLGNGKPVPRGRLYFNKSVRVWNYQMWFTSCTLIPQVVTNSTQNRCVGLFLAGAHHIAFVLLWFPHCFCLFLLWSSLLWGLIPALYLERWVKNSTWKCWCFCTMNLNWIVFWRKQN